MIKVIQTGPFSVNTLVVPLCKNKVFIVDPACCDFCADEKAVSSWIEANKLETVAIVLTHGHFDHVSGLKFLHRVYPDNPVLIHKDDSMLIGQGSEAFQSRALSYMGFEDFIPSVSNLPEADGFLEEGKTLAEYVKTQDQELKTSLSQWKILHTPGHTMGCVCLYNSQEKLLISGDTLFYRSWGRTDLGGSEALIQQSLRRLKAEIDGEAVVFPGHEYYGFKMKDNF